MKEGRPEDAGLASAADQSEKGKAAEEAGGGFGDGIGFSEGRGNHQIVDCDRLA
jgi:hypothetical protein